MLMLNGQYQSLTALKYGCKPSSCYTEQVSYAQIHGCGYPEADFSIYMKYELKNLRPFDTEGVSS